VTFKQGDSYRNTSQGDRLLGQPKFPLKFKISLWTVENRFDSAWFPAYNSLSFQTWRQTLVIQV